jgi:hypothetical protein
VLRAHANGPRRCSHDDRNELYLRSDDQSMRPETTVSTAAPRWAGGCEVANGSNLGYRGACRACPKYLRLLPESLQCANGQSVHIERS